MLRGIVRRVLPILATTLQQARPNPTADAAPDRQVLTAGCAGFALRERTRLVLEMLRAPTVE